MHTSHKLEIKYFYENNTFSCTLKNVINNKINNITVHSHPALNCESNGTKKEQNFIYVLEKSNNSNIFSPDDVESLFADAVF